MKEYTIQDMETRLEQLYNDIRATAIQLDQIDKAMEDMEKDPMNQPLVEQLYAKEFSLCVDNSSIYEDIQNIADKIRELEPDNFKARRLQKDTEKYLRVAIIDL